MNGTDEAVKQKISRWAQEYNIPVSPGRICRTSSRFCLGVEHGDYNGTELFGVGTDRFIWMAYAPASSSLIRIFSGNYPEAGVIEFSPDKIPPPRSPDIKDSWARFPMGAAYVLQQAGYHLNTGINAVIYGNIPGGGMSRSASLSLNLILALFDVNNIPVADKFSVAVLAQAVENDYIGSPCGLLDQIMIIFAQQGLGTYYAPHSRSIDHIPFGGHTDFRLVSLDTGTIRPGLEKSTYKIRRAECEEFVSLLKPQFNINYLADIKEKHLFTRIMQEFNRDQPALCRRLKYIFSAQKRFQQMVEAWKKGDIAEVGAIFRQDGIGLRDDYAISGPELETMCDIARTVKGVYGERMLGGGDKGAAGALVETSSLLALEQAVAVAYPRSYPDLKDRYAVHSLQTVDGVHVSEWPAN